MFCTRIEPAQPSVMLVHCVHIELLSEVFMNGTYCKQVVCVWGGGGGGGGQEEEAQILDDEFQGFTHFRLLLFWGGGGRGYTANLLP